MKKLQFILPSVAMAWLILILAPSCSYSKKVVGSRERTPFSQNRYTTDKKNYRAVGNAEGSQQTTAMEKARTNARALLAQEIETEVKKVNDIYMEEYDMGGASKEYSSEFQSMIRTVTNKVLMNVKEKDSRLYTKKVKNSDKKKVTVYNAYVVMELNRKDFQKQLENAALQNDKLKSHFNKENFQKIFDQETEKLPDPEE